MDLSKLLSFLAALSLATERIVEVIKGAPFLSKWFAVQKENAHTEELRKASIHVLAIAVGTILASELASAAGVPSGTEHNQWWFFLIYGAMASGGSGLWNSALDIFRQVNQQKQIVTDRIKKGQTPLPVAPAPPAPGT